MAAARVIDIVFSSSCTVYGAPTTLPHRVAQRRAGDAPAVYADPAMAATELGWTAALGLDAMCRDAFNWQQQNPRGYP